MKLMYLDFYAERVQAIADYSCYIKTKRSNVHVVFGHFILISLDMVQCGTPKVITLMYDMVNVFFRHCIFGFVIQGILQTRVNARSVQLGQSFHRVVLRQSAAGTKW